MTYPMARRNAGPDDKTLTIAVYILYLLGFPTVGATAFVGVIMAYVLKGRAGDRAFSHYVFLIRTFWGALTWALIGGFLFVLGVSLLIVLIGFPILWLSHAIHVLVAVWYVVRCIVGLIAALNDRAYPRPRAWII